MAIHAAPVLVPAEGLQLGELLSLWWFLLFGEYKMITLLQLLPAAAHRDILMCTESML